MSDFQPLTTVDVVAALALIAVLLTIIAGAVEKALKSSCQNRDKQAERETRPTDQ